MLNYLTVHDVTKHNVTSLNQDLKILRVSNSSQNTMFDRLAGTKSAGLSGICELHIVTLKFYLQVIVLCLMSLRTV